MPHLLRFLAAGALALACSGKTGTGSLGVEDSDAGAPGGGASGTGGLGSSGGAPSAGGVASSGGMVSAGGVAANGGAPTTGGATGTGGAPVIPAEYCPTDTANGQKELAPNPSYGIAGKMSLKLVEGAHIRLRNGRLFLDPSTMLPEDPGILACWGLTVEETLAALEAMNALFAEGGVTVTPVFTNQTPQENDGERARLRAESGEYLDNLNLFYGLDFPPEGSETIAQALAKSPIVSSSTFAQIPAPPP